MAAIGHFLVAKHKSTRVGHVLGDVCTSLFGQAICQLWAISPGQSASVPVRVNWLAGDVDLGIRRCVLAGVGDELFDLIVSGSGVRKDADLHPDGGRLAIVGGLLVKPLPGLRVAVGPSTC